MASTGDGGPALPGHLRRSIALVMLAIVTVQVGWLLAVPAFHGPDEVDHVFRAASVASGQWQASTVPPEDGRGHLLPVPLDLVEAASGPCEALAYVGPDNCAPTTRPNARGQVLIASAAASYNPTWYLVLGTVARPFDGTTAVLAMRLGSALLCDLALGAALWLLASRTGSRWALLGTALACTPVLLYSSATAAPNGLGYCAGLLLWASLLTLPRGPTERLAGPLAGLAISAPTVMVTHSTGLAWVGLSLVCAAPLLLPRVRHLWASHRPALVVVTLVLVVAAGLSAAWVLLNGTNDPRADGGADRGPASAGTLLQGLVLWPLQSIATLRLRNDAAPIEVYAVGVAVITLFVAWALRAGNRAERVSIIAVALTSLLVPLAATAATHRHVGAAWQGRYGLALSVGALVVAAVALSRTEVPTVWVGWSAAGALSFMHWATLAAMFHEGLPGTPQSWAPWVAVAGAAITTIAWGLALGPRAERGA